VESNWGRVFYTNLWASVLAGTLSAATEPRTLHHYRWTDSSMIALSVSCVLGVSMSYFAFLCRAQVSATCFTVIGNACKIITVFINVMIWDKHASTQGMACLGVALVAAFFYQQSPKRSVPDPDMEEAPLQHAVAT
jgi:GDP-mannose transporter